jgi:hypothetical protein
MRDNCAGSCSLVLQFSSQDMVVRLARLFQCQHVCFSGLRNLHALCQHARCQQAFRWTKQGCIFAGGELGAFDSRGAASHCIVRDLDTHQFFMFYEALNDSGRRSIGFSVSNDGIKGWRRHPKPVLEGSGVAGSWDCAEVGAPYAVPMAAGRWRLYYAGRGPGDSAWRGIGLALSEDQEDALAAPVCFRRRVA